MPKKPAPQKYFRQLLHGAGRDTWAVVVDNRFSAVLFTAVIASLAIYLQRQVGALSHSQMKEAFVSLGFGIGSSVAVYALMFLAHFFYLTPKRLCLAANAEVEKINTLISESAAKKPDFFYEGNGSEITQEFFLRDEPYGLIGRVKWLLRFENGGEGTAHDLGVRIYGCWINDIPLKAFVIDTVESCGRTPPKQCKNLGFIAERKASENSFGNLYLKAKENTLVILIEIEFLLEPNDNSWCKNEPIWLTWDAQIPSRMSDSSSEEVCLVKAETDKLKQEMSVPTPPA